MAANLRTQTNHDIDVYLDVLVYPPNSAFRFRKLAG